MRCSAATMWELRVNRLCIASVSTLLLLVGCTHERGAARPPGPQAATTPSTPAPPPLDNSPASSAPEAPPSSPPSAAVPPVNLPETIPAPDAAAAPALPKTGSQAGAARSSPSSRRTSQPEIASTSAAAEAIHPSSPPVVPPRTAITATPALDLTGLEQRLRDTRAIGLFTKLSLKNQVDDLLAQFRSFYNGNSKASLAELRQKFELLLLKVVTLLQDDDPSLATAVSSSREAIWGVLSDPKKFASI